MTAKIKMNIRPLIENIIYTSIKEAWDKSYNPNKEISACAIPIRSEISKTIMSNLDKIIDFE